VRPVAEWRRIEEELPGDWSSVQLALEVPDPEERARAAALLAPAAPGRAGGELRFAVHRGGAGAAPEAIRRLLRRLDSEGIQATLRLVAAAESEPAPAPEPTAPEPAGLAAAWQAKLASLPPDWSDLYCELELPSSDYLQRAALLLAPTNPAKTPERSGFRFRVARRFGYGASPAMARRCLERLDTEGIRGQVTILRALSDTHNVATQGPVWYVGGRAV
jgi:hypothetical protein